MNKPCQKCGGHWVSGPRYIIRFGQELLLYECVCGYWWTEPTKDSVSEQG
jgi:hypothetical protein